MNARKILSCSFALVLGLTLYHAPASAAPTPIACGTAIDSYFTGALPGGWLNVVGTRLASRGSLGFSSFTMNSGFQIGSTPLNTPAAANASTFLANKGSANYEGQFNEVFPSRGNNDVDVWDFWVYRTGELWLRSITWAGSWTQLQGVTCYRGPQNQTVMTAYGDTPGFGTDFWVFVVQGETLH